MADLTPNNREEYWLKGMVDGQTTLEPNKRREYWYKEIVDAIGSGGGGGTGGGALLKVGVTVEEGTATMDKTWTEISTAFNSGLVFALIPNGVDPVTNLYIVDMVGEAAEMYAVGLRNLEFNSTSMFIASSADGYPVCNDF